MPQAPELLPTAAEASPNTFLLPPRLLNAHGVTRRAGFELEYGGVDLHRSAELVKAVFGGDISQTGTFKYRVIDTRWGDFRVEVDSSLLKDQAYETPLRALGLDPDALDLSGLEKAIGGVMTVWMPFEIVTPPIPLDALGALDDLRVRLMEHQARGTGERLWYAFGMHINPETPDMTPATLLAYVRAFILLAPWLEKRVKVDATRSVSGYINRFPASYARLVLGPDYPDAPAAEQLIDDYLAHNPTRNRPLDMLPVLACLNEERVRAGTRSGDLHLVSARPAFHYRLPNCSVDEAHWSLAREWNTWVTVERLANRPDLIAEMSREFLRTGEGAFWPFSSDRWPQVLKGYVGAADGPGEARP